MCLQDMHPEKPRKHYWKVFKEFNNGQLMNTYTIAKRTEFHLDWWMTASDENYGFHAFLTKKEAMAEKRDWSEGVLGQHRYIVKKVLTKDTKVQEGDFWLGAQKLRAVSLQTLYIPEAKKGATSALDKQGS